jgi:diguanylate cyclase (GGDEF)-like protein
VGRRELELTAPAVRRALRLGEPRIRILLLAGCLAAIAIGVAASSLRGMAAPSAGALVPWWALALGFLCTELLVIHVDVQRDTYSVSMMELPLVVGLFLANPLAVVAARLAGSAAAVAVNRRQVPIKVAFNFSLYACETCIAIVVFHAVAGDVAATDPHAWFAAFAAMLVANVVSLAGVALAMHLHGADLRGRFRGMVAGALVPPVATTSLALAGVTLLWTEPRSAWLLAAIGVVLAAAYRGYAGLRRRHANLRRLYELTRRIQASTDETAMRAIVEASADLMRAEEASIAVLGDDEARVCTLRDGNIIDSVVPTAALDPVLMRVAETRVPLFVPRRTKRSGAEISSEIPEWRDYVVVPSETDSGVRAVMAVANRADDVSTFDREDVTLFHALVNHCTMALANAQLLGRLRHDAWHDGLTGLVNRSHFHAQVSAAIACRTRGTRLAVMLMDLDRFKEVNDTLGHHFGDQLLVEVGARLSHLVTRGGAVARLGGDEFALLVPTVEDEEDALAEACAVRETLAKPFDLGELSVDVDGTIGIAICPDHGEDASTLLQRADVAMYGAKVGAGIEVYTSERDHYSPRRLALASELREAIEDDRLLLHYQPKLDVATATVCGAEALVRWPHPKRGMIAPDEFIPIAEQTGLIRPLTLWVLRRAIADCARWRTLGHQVGVAANVSARNLLDIEFVERLHPLLESSALPSAELTLEITESSIMSDVRRTSLVLNELAGVGVRISIDDFGTGYSSLNYLKQLPVDEVKIDKSFVQTMTADAGDAAIVRSVIDLGNHLGMKVVAEGVETDAALRLLRAFLCPVAQGFLFSRPLPFEAFVEWMAASEAGPPSEWFAAATNRLEIVG